MNVTENNGLSPPSKRVRHEANGHRVDGSSTTLDDQNNAILPSPGKVQPMAKQFEDLFPLAIRAVLTIWRYLSPSDLALCGLVSKKWRATILANRDQLAKFPIRVIFRFNERGAAYPGYTIAKYYDRRRFPIDIDAMSDTDASCWLRHCNVESVRFGYDMNCYLDCYGDGLRDAFLDYLTRQRHWFLKDVISVSFDRVKMLALSRRSLSDFLMACSETLSSLQFSAVSIKDTSLINAEVISALSRLKHLVIHEPRPEHAIPRYPTDPYADIGDTIFALAIRQIESENTCKMRLNYCGQITVAGIVGLIEKWSTVPVATILSVHIRHSPLLSRQSFINECLQAALPCKFHPTDNDIMHFMHKRRPNSLLCVVIDCKDETYEQPSFYISTVREPDSIGDASDDETESYVSMCGGSDNATDSESE